MNSPSTSAHAFVGIRFRALKRDRPLRTVVLDQLLDANHPARLINDWIARLDFTVLLSRIRARDSQPGAPVLDPRMLFAVWLFATIEGISSARELARRCQRDLPYLWLSGQTRPNYHTLSDFYAENEEFLQSVFTDHLEALLEHGLITLKQVTLDGRKIPASASKESFHREPTLRRHQQQVQEHLANLAAQRVAESQASQQKQAAQKRAAGQKAQRLQAALQVVQQRQGERAANRRQDRPPPEDARASLQRADGY